MNCEAELECIRDVLCLRSRTLQHCRRENRCNRLCVRHQWKGEQELDKVRTDTLTICRTAKIALLEKRAGNRLMVANAKGEPLRELMLPG